jgi:cytochrome b
MKHVKVWDIQTRIFHWGLALLTICCLVIADIPGYLGINAIYSDMWLGIHISAGTAIVLMILFRIFWGFAGPFYSKFSSFHLRISMLWKYLKEIFSKIKTIHTGHNPAASWFTVATIILSTLVFITGLIVYGVDESRGIFKFLHEDYYQYAAEVKLSHFIVAALLLSAIILHMSGVFLESFLHKTGTAKSMFTGKKRSEETVPVVRTKTVFSILHL